MILNLSKRMLLLVLACMMMVSQCIISVSAEYIMPDETPALGTVFFDDFESYSQRTDAMGGHPYSSGGGTWPATVDGNKVWAAGNGTASSLWWQPSANATAIDSGKLVISARIMVKSGYEGSITNSSNQYPSVYFGLWNNSTNVTSPYLAIANLGTQGAVVTDGGFYATSSNANGSDSTHFTADEFHELALVSDYTSRMTYVYLDGLQIAQMSGARAIQPSYQFGVVTGGLTATTFPADGKGNMPYIYVDNLKFERISDTLSATVNHIGGNRLDVVFSTSVKNLNVNVADIGLTSLNGEPVTVTGATVNSARDTLSLTLGGTLEAGQGYRLTLGNTTFVSVVDASKTLTWPSEGMAFAMALQETVVLNQDFEIASFPTSGGTTDVDWMEVSVSNGLSDNSFQDMSAWTFNQDVREYAYVTPETISGSRALSFKSWMPFSASQSSQSLVLPFTQAVKGGVVTVEFDAEFVSDYGNRFAIGLRDTEASVSSYNPWQSWGNATYLGGLTYWSGTTRKALVMNSVDKPNMLPDWYLYYHTPAEANYNPFTGSKGADHASVVNNNFTIKQDTSTLGENMKTWKYVIDLDNQTYSFYLNDVLQKTLGYIPGGEIGTYDAFVATIVAPGHSSTSAANDMNVYLDNVKVTHRYNIPELVSARMTNVYDQDIILADGLTKVSTGMLKATLDFSVPMDAASVRSEITVSSNKEPAVYNVVTEGNRVVVNFPNGLQAKTTYTIDLGRVTSQYGHPIAVSDSFSFTTDSGEYLISGPSITVDGEPLSSLSMIQADSQIEAVLVVINTVAGETPRSAAMYVAAYQEGQLTGAKKASVPAMAGVSQVKIPISPEADGFLGADKIKVFLFNNTTDLQPLKEAVEFPGNYAAASFASYNVKNEAVSKTAISKARLGTGAVPTLNSYDGRSGWVLDADNGHAAYIAVDLDGSFTDGLDTDETVQVEIDYLDDSWGGWALIYQGTDGEQQGSYQQMTNSGVWRTATFTLENASFANDCNSYDFFIAASDANLTNYRQTYKTFMGTSPFDVTIGAVRVSKLRDSISPFDIFVETDFAGNIFVYGEFGNEMQFDITYDDPKGKYTSGQAEYIVKNYNGVEVWKDTRSFTGGKDTLVIPYDKATGLVNYGLYTLEIKVSGNSISQKKIVDFAITLKGETNMHYGGNVHFDWEAYSQDDIKDIVSLFKTAGLGIFRTKVTWNDFDKNADGIAEITTPDHTLWAQEYIDSVGLETLCILDCTNWAAADNVNGKNYCTLKQAQYRKSFADFCAWVVSPDNYGKYTDYFSVINEYNLYGPNNWHPYDNYTTNHQWDSYDDYVAIAKEVYPAIKASNSNATVITGELGRYEREWIDAAYAEGLGDYSDIFSYHQYEFYSGPEYYANYYHSTNQWWVTSPWGGTQDIKTRITKNMDEEIWLTETGTSMRANEIGASVSGIPSTIDRASKWIPRTYALYGYELDKVFPYAFTDNNIDYFESENNFGIIRSHDYRTPFAAKPAYIGVAALNYFTGGAEPVAPTFIGNESDRRERGFVLNYGPTKNYKDGVIMAWKGDNAGTKSFNPSISGASTLIVYDWYGNYVTTIANGASLELVPEPYYIVKAN